MYIFFLKDVYSNEQNPRSPPQVLPLSLWNTGLCCKVPPYNWEAFYKALFITIEIKAQMINFCKATGFLLFTCVKMLGSMVACYHYEFGLEM